MQEEPQVPDVRLTDETIEFLEQKMQKAVAEGIKAAMTKEAAERFWATGLAVLQQQAVQKGRDAAGGLVIGALKKGLLFMFLGALVYSIGGWSALAALWKAIMSSGT